MKFLLFAFAIVAVDCVIVTVFILGRKYSDLVRKDKAKTDLVEWDRKSKIAALREQRELRR